MKTIKLLMLSGGIDSTYLAWRLVKENTPNLHIHYISIRNSIEKIWEEQDKRIPQIIKYLRNMDNSFKFSKSRFDFFGFGKVGWDSDIVLLVGQKVALNQPGCRTELIIGWNPFDMTRPIVADRAERRVTPNIWEALIESAKNKDDIEKKLSFPLIEDNITKTQIIKEMPKELLDLTWSCRHPENGKPCKRCHACIEVRGGA